MPPFPAARGVVSTLGFFSRQKNGLPPLVVRGFASAAPNSSRYSMARAMEEVHSKDLDGLPASKFSIIEKIPDAIKGPLFEDLYQEVRRNSYADVIHIVTDQNAVKRRGAFIIDTLTKESRSGNKSAAIMEKVFTDFAAGRVSHFHIKDGFPTIDVGEENSFTPAHNQRLGGSLVNREFFRKVGIDNHITSPEDSAQKILENVANIAFSFSSFYAMGYNYPNQAELPIFCFRTTHPQHPHTDSVTSKQSLALSLYAINADRSVKTFVVDLAQALYFLTPEEIELLHKKVYYVPRGDDAVKSANPEELFSILESVNGRQRARFDGKPMVIRIDQELVKDPETIQKMYFVIDKLNAAVDRMIQKNKITNIGLGTREFLDLDNRSTLHGRIDSGRAGGDGEYLDHDYYSLSGPNLKTSSGAERRVARMLVGAPEDRKDAVQDAGRKLNIRSEMPMTKVAKGKLVAEGCAVSLADPAQTKPQVR